MEALCLPCPHTTHVQFSREHIQGSDGDLIHSEDTACVHLQDVGMAL